MNRYAHLHEPEDELDFHGLGPIRPAEVKRKTLDFVEDARARGCSRVRIVTGKGLHSAGKPVVRPQVERTLRSLATQGRIVGFRIEKVGHGAEGAFFVQIT